MQGGFSKRNIKNNKIVTEVKKGDIIICKSGYYGHEDRKHVVSEEPLYGGAGYVDGLMAQADSNLSLRDDSMNVTSSFNDMFGVFLRAVRPANMEEKYAYELGMRNINEILEQHVVISEKKITFEIGEAVVCIPGFVKGDNDKNPGGSGYAIGRLFEVDRISNNKQTDKTDYVYWEKENGKGVFGRALRLATIPEIEALKKGIKNINDIPEKKLFKISYISTLDKIQKIEIFAFIESDAIASIKDLKSVNYIMSDSSVTEDDFVEPVIMEHPYVHKEKYDVIVVNSGPAKLGVVKLVKDLTGLGLKDSKDFVDSLPHAIFEGVSKERAEEVKKELEEAGAKVELK